MANASKPLILKDVVVNEHCTGEQWTLLDFDQLAYLIAVIALGQAQHVAIVLAGLNPGSPVLGLTELKDQAKKVLTVAKTKPWQRDGFIFEAISWIAAQQAAGPGDFMRDPHIKSTTQGLDGLLIHVEKGAIARSIIFEDKCSGDPKKIFAGQVMKSFRDYHAAKRSGELLAAAGELLRQADLPALAVPKAAAAILDLKKRRYRASLAVTPDVDSDVARAEIFTGYENLAGLTADQRLGAVFKIPDSELRPWFEALATAARSHVDAQTATAMDDLTDV
ncbi:hypothetical protein [Caulobacter sp. BP25]|uniref:hypothetical protein n=1 Tax=Caulobacter sp. BP25 TaxID=2048900 RepID=UPI00117D6143|nr:hypothetical protein [Caulobacter sp. BP25]